MNNVDIDLSQPENALFLDDDADWGNLDDLEIEEAAVAAAVAAAEGGAQQQQQQHNGNMATNHTSNGQRDAPTRTNMGPSTATTSRDDDQAAFEIEEDFLPSNHRVTAAQQSGRRSGNAFRGVINLTIVSLYLLQSSTIFSFASPKEHGSILRTMTTRAARSHWKRFERVVSAIMFTSLIHALVCRWVSCDCQQPFSFCLSLAWVSK